MALGQDLRGLVERVYRNDLIPGLVIGVEAELTRRAAGNYDPESGMHVSGGEPETRRILFRAYTRHEIERGRDLLIQGDVEIRMIAEAGRAAPEPNDAIDLDGMNYRIVAVTPRYLDGAPLEYICHGRK